MERYLEFVVNHYILSLALAVVVYLLIQDLVESAFKKFSSLSPMMAVTKMNSGDVTIVDVREPNEYSKGHIENAINIPLAKLDERISEISAQKAEPLLVVCQTGTRAIPACKTLNKAGFTELYNINGGMQAWEDNKLPIRTSGKKS